LANSFRQQPNRCSSRKVEWIGNVCIMSQRNYFASWANYCKLQVNRQLLQRAILNFTPGPQGITSPLGVNLVPRGELCPLGVKFTPSFTPSFTPRGEHSLLFRRMEGGTENFTPRG
jgi:hypothetical protein